MPALKWARAAVCLLLLATAGCTAGEPQERLRVLASSDLADMQPVLDDLRRDTNVELVMDYDPRADSNDPLRAGDGHDLAWLPSDRAVRLSLEAAGRAAAMPPSNNIMTSPVVIGIRPAAAARLRAATPGGQLTWADVADAAAAGRITFGMADPRQASSGLAALVGVATAASGTGQALRPEDVTCDRLNGFFSGQNLTGGTSAEVVQRFVEHGDGTDALVAYESTLLSLNAGGRLAQPLEIVYPRDGIVLAEYPLMLLRPEHRQAYDRVVQWLMTGPAQRKIMERTLRRPLNSTVARDPGLQAPIGNSLFFPEQHEVIDKLLGNYAAGDGSAGHVIFVLDFSGSMRGERMARLRAAFAGLGGVDRSPSGKFARLHRGEQVTLILFGRRVLRESSFVVRGQGDVDAMNALLSAADDLDDGTAVWSALSRGYRVAEAALREHPRQPVSIVLMTDGENNTGSTLPQFLDLHRALPPAARAVRTYPIRFGEADPGELGRVAAATGGRVTDATVTTLQEAFKDVRGCG